MSATILRPRCRDRGSKLAALTLAMLALFVATREAVGADAPAARAYGTVRLGVAVADAPFASVFIASARGYFAQAGIDVRMQATGANTIASVVSGQVDLGMFGTGQALLPVKQGKATTVIYNFLGAGNAGAVGVAADSPVRRLEDLAGKRVGVLGGGGASFGWGQIYSEYAKKNGAGPFNVISQGQVGTLVSSVASGQLDAVVGTGSWFYTNPKIRVLVDPTQPDVKAKFVGEPYAEASIFGLSSWVRDNRELVTRFLAALMQADQVLRSTSAADIAAQLARDPAFAGQSQQTIEASVRYNQSFYSPTKGNISAADWNISLARFSAWNLGITASAPEYSYAQRVDMSYLRDAERLGLKFK